MSSRGGAIPLRPTYSDIPTSQVTNLTNTWSIMECWAAQDEVTRFLYYFYGYIKISTHFFLKPLLGYLWYPHLHLATVADHAGKRICISLGIQAQLLEVKTHGYQHLEQGELLLGGLVHQGRAGGVALGPLAGVHQVKRATFGRGPVVAGCLQIPVPALQGSWQRGAFNLETHPVTRNTTRQRLCIRHKERGKV